MKITKNDILNELKVGSDVTAIASFISHNKVYHDKEGKVFVNDMEIPHCWDIEFHEDYPNDLYIERYEDYSGETCKRCDQKEVCRWKMIILEDINISKNAIPMTDRELGKVPQQGQGYGHCGHIYYYPERNGYYFEGDGVWIDENVYSALKIGFTLDQCREVLTASYTKINQMNHSNNTLIEDKEIADFLVKNASFYTHILRINPYPKEEGNV